MQRTLKVRVPLALAAVCGLAVAIGCASTEMRLTSTWTDPAANTTPLRKVAVVCLSPDEGLRRGAETAAAQQVIEGARVTPGYEVLSESDLRDREVVTAKLLEQGFDGVLLIRPTAVTEQFSPIGTPYGTFSAYYDWAQVRVYSPRYLPGDAVVHIISNLYSIRDDKLVWSGTSRSFDPISRPQAVGGVSKSVAQEIQKDRLIL